MVRTVGSMRSLAKVKNPRFEEIAVTGQGPLPLIPRVDTAPLDAAATQRILGQEFAARYILATRAASVASKASSEDLDQLLSKKGGHILRALALALLVDALEDARQGADPVMSSIVQGSIGYQVALSASFATMAAFAKSR